VATHAQIVEEARTWLGVKWQHQGRTKHGIDCVGIPIMVGMVLELTTYNPIDYPRRPDGSFLKQFDEHLIRKPVRDAVDGDVLVFSESGHVCHCGIHTTKHGEPAVLHSHAKRRQVIEEPLTQALSVIGKPVFCYAFPGVED